MRATLQQPITLLPEEGRKIQIGGGQIVFKLTARDTDGRFSLAEFTMPPNAGPLPHLHRVEDETFLVQEGTFEFLVGEKTLGVSAGGCVHVPRGVLHAFRNVGEGTGRLLVHFTPAGMEDYFVELAALVGQANPDGAALVDLMERYDMEVPTTSEQANEVVRRNLETIHAGR